MLISITSAEANPSNYWSADYTASLVSAFVTSGLDYCNAVLAGLPKSTLAPLQRVQNAAAKLITGIYMRDHVTPALQQLHWLPVPYRVTYKLCLLMHLIHIGHSPAYLTGLSTATAKLASRRGLRSAYSQRYEIPRTALKFGEQLSRLPDHQLGTFFQSKFKNNRTPKI